VSLMNYELLQTTFLAKTVPMPHWTTQVIFAVMLLTAFAFLVQGTWNGLMAEFPQMGRLSYPRAIHIASIAGLVVVSLIYLLL